MVWGGRRWRRLEHCWSWVEPCHVTVAFTVHLMSAGQFLNRWSTEEQHVRQTEYNLKSCLFSSKVFSQRSLSLLGSPLAPATALAILPGVWHTHSIHLNILILCIFSGSEAFFGEGSVSVGHSLFVLSGFRCSYWRKLLEVNKKMDSPYQFFLYVVWEFLYDCVNTPQSVQIWQPWKGAV